MDYGQLLTAMVTPFDKDGEIDYPATSKLLDHLIDTGTDAVVVAGTTGESPTLTSEEKLELFAYVVKEVDGRIPVIAGTGSNDTRASIELTKEASKLNIDGIMLVAPYYNRPSQEGLYEHFKAIAAATELPVMLYNIPGRTGVNVEVDTIVELSKIKNITSVKEASGDLDAMAEIIERTDADSYMYSGDASVILPILAIGGQGIVSVSAHVVGNEMKAMITAYTSGILAEASALHRKLLPTFKAIFAAPSPTPLKALLNEIDVAVGGVRLPLIPLTSEQLADVKSRVEIEGLSNN